MTEAFDVKVNSSRIRVKLDELPGEVRSELRTVAQVLVNELKSVALDEAESHLQEHTGKYLAGFRSAVRSTAKGVTGILRNRSKVGHWVEYGASRKASDIMPNARQALHFLAGAGEVFAGLVHHPASEMPAFGILHKALGEMKGTIVSELTGAVRDASARIVSEG